jgi:DMSO/TMAO reductase YedYZ heme-binding membrane subunit
MRRTRPLPWLKPGVFVGALTPLAAILLRAWRGELGANPIAHALNQLGLVALVFLVAALACTPLKTLFGWTWPIRLRRMLGLFGFFYGRHERGDARPRADFADPQRGQPVLARPQGARTSGLGVPSHA